MRVDAASGPRRRLHLLLALSSIPALLTAIPRAASAALPADAVEFVIITDAELAPAFAPLAAFKSDIGMASRVVTLDWIVAHAEPDGDLPATIRRFLQDAHEQWATAYVLLGGGLDIVPTRRLHNAFHPPAVGTDLPVDLYYACLDGTWDGDGDGIYGEPYASASDPGDDADMEPELALGRAPVSSPDEAARFVAKTIAFHMQVGPLVFWRAMLAADVIFPWDWEPGDIVVLDGATRAEQARGWLEAADPPWQVQRYYENHTAFPGVAVATASSVLDAMATGGYRLVYHLGTAWGDSLEVGQGFVSGDQLAQLQNDDPFFMVLLGTDGARLDGPSPLARAMSAPSGGGAGGLGATDAAFPSRTFLYHTSFFQHLLATPGARIGDALKATLLEHAADARYPYDGRWTHMTLALLGDPTLPLAATELPVSISRGGRADDDPPEAADRAQLTAAPNPFNPRIAIRAELTAPGRVRLSVCDIRGAEIRVLADGPRAAGAAHWSWDGCDRDGRSVASGAYIVRLETERRIVRRSVTLLR